MAEMQEARATGGAGQSKSMSKVFNAIGAVTSLALIVGVGIWGYKLVIRDVSGVPVIRAAEGPMRVQPKDPGGAQALHQGLSVNAVAAEGTAEGPAERLILAPEPLELTLEDTEIARLDALDLTGRDSGESLGGQRGEDAGPDDAAMRFASVQALADRLAEGVAPLEALPEDEEEEPDLAEEAAAEAAPAEDEPPRVEGGLGRSLRPKLRPATLATAPVDVALASVAGATVRDIDPATIPVGTRLAQLGAFASREIAVKEWNDLTDRFADYLDGKNRVIQKATSGGRTFYRLRAMGFEDLSDARRFCSALVAERAECIPVVTR